MFVFGFTRMNIRVASYFTVSVVYKQIICLLSEWLFKSVSNKSLKVL